MAEKEPSSELYPPLDVVSYRDALREAGEGHLDIAALERSEFFRHKKDCEALIAMVRENQSGKPLSMLDVGVANMEEVVSYLAALYSELDEKRLEELIHMTFVDIREREDIKLIFRLGKQLLDKTQPVYPKAYKESFMLVEGEYEPRPAIKQYIEDHMKDGPQSYWGMPIENFTRIVPSQFDVVSFNNILQHMGGMEEYPSPYKNKSAESFDRYYHELSRILGLVKEGGIIFVHAPAPGDVFDTKGKGARKVLKNIPGFEEDFQEISPGIFRKNIKTLETASQ